MDTQFFLLIPQLHKMTSAGELQFLTINKYNSKVQGWRSGESTRLSPMWPVVQCGTIPRSSVKCGLRLLNLYSAPKSFLQELRFTLYSKTKI